MHHLNLSLFLGVASLFVQGCFEKDGTFTGPNPKEPYDHLVDYKYVHSSRHKGVVPVEYKMKGVYGPDRLHIANDANIGTVLDLEVILFPEFSNESNHAESFRQLKLIAEQHVRNYVGSQQDVIVFTLKRLINHELKYFALDIKNPERDIALSDYLVTRGLVQVDHEVAKLSGMDYLIQLEKEARKQDLGIWKLDLE